MKLRFRLDGHPIEVDAPSLARLNDVLRDGLERPFPETCGDGSCGACAVRVDGELQRACRTAACMVQGREVLTAAGLDPAEPAVAALGEGSCPACRQGLPVAVLGLAGTPPAELRAALTGVSCRCTGWQRRIDAVSRTHARPGTGTRPSPQTPVQRRELPGPDPGVTVAADKAAALSARKAFPDAAILGGGSWVLVESASGSAVPAAILDLRKVTELRGIQIGSAKVRIGAQCTAQDLWSNPGLAAAAPLLHEAVRAVGGPLLRAPPSVGGVLALGRPESVFLPTLMAMDAVVELQSADRGVRRASLDGFYSGPRQPRLQRDELITAVEIPLAHSTDKVGFRKVPGVVMAGLLRFKGGKVSAARIAFGGMAPLPRRCPLVEEALVGGPVRPSVAELAARELDPPEENPEKAAWKRKVAVSILRAWLETL